MTVLSIGTDRSIFTEGSLARMRAESYAKNFGTLQVVVFSLKKHGLKPFHGRFLHAYPTNSFSRLAYVFDAVRLLRRLPGEIITAQDPFECGLAGLLGGNGRPLHIQLHTDPFAPAFISHSLFNRVRLLVMPLVLARASRVRVVSQRLKKEVERRYPRLPVSVLPIFIDSERFHSIVRTEHERFSPALLWIGRFEKEKNPELALHALGNLVKTFPQAGMVMLGGGSLEPALKLLAQKLGIVRQVEFAGWQDPADYLAKTNLLLVTSQYEGYGRQIIEALAAGVPVLSRDVGIAREAGAIIAQGDFVRSLEEWAKDGPRRGELREYPYKNLEEYVVKYCADIAGV